MISFASLMLFAVTGITLNHPDRFGADKEVIRDDSGEINSSWLVGDVNRLAIAETLRAKHHLQGAVSEFVSDSYCLLYTSPSPRDRG